MITSPKCLKLGRHYYGTTKMLSINLNFRHTAQTFFIYSQYSIHSGISNMSYFPGTFITISQTAKLEGHITHKKVILSVRDVCDFKNHSDVLVIFMWFMCDFSAIFVIILWFFQKCTRFFRVIWPLVKLRIICQYVKINHMC